MRNVRLSCEKKENFRRLEVLEVSKLTYKLEKSFFLKQQRENQLFITKKINELNQKLTEIVIGE